ncbi:MAG: T9SS type A sorting domain-containing protein [Bacteroidota bacterium]
MKNLRSVLLVLSFLLIYTTSCYSQETYFAADDKIIGLLDVKLLKTGEIVFLEKYRDCGTSRVKLLHPNGDIENIWSDGKAEFYSFLEMPDNNWVLILISDRKDDIVLPFNFTSVVFIDGDYTIFSTDDSQTNIDLTNISKAAVINDSELVLSGGSKAYFTDFNLSSVITKDIQNSISILKSPLPDSNYVYYQYTGEDAIRATNDQFETEELIAFNLGPHFRDIHYLDRYVIMVDETEISVLEGLFGFFYIEQETTIYNFRQHGQNLTYHTISEDNILTFKKLYLDENETLQESSFEIPLEELANGTRLFWDANLLGMSYSFTPLPSESYEDEYRGFNYVFDYNLQDEALSTQELDLSIDNISYTTLVDTVVVSDGKLRLYADIFMEVTVTNHSDETVDEIEMYSSAFEGINCAYNGLKPELENITIAPNQSVVINANYESLEFTNLYFLQHPLCLYVLAGNKRFDSNFDDNIFCLPLSEFTSTEELQATNQISISPNPVKDQIQLECQSPATFHVYSMQGELIKVWESYKKRTTFDISAFSSGNYFLVDRNSGKSKMFMKL